MESPRFYPSEKNPGRYYASVTTILSLLEKPALVPWAAKMEREAALDVFEEFLIAVSARWHTRNMDCGGRMGDDIRIINETLAMYTRADFRERIKVKKAVKKATSDAANIGTLVHARAEAEMKGEHLPPLEVMDATGHLDEALTAQAIQAWGAYENWRQQAGLEDPITEIRLIHDEEQYAGTADLIARDNYGRLALWDYKTSKRANDRVPRGHPDAVYPSYMMQLAAYMNTARHLGHPVETGYVIRLPKSAEDGFEVVELDDFERRLKGFLAFRDAFYSLYPDAERKHAEKARKE